MTASSPLFCTHCGVANQQQASFCFACGHALQHTTTADTPTADNGSSDATDHLAPGNLLKGRYRIINQLGKGGMGAVYQADDTLFTGRLVAVKEMSQSGLNSQQRVGAADDFKREAHMLADLHNPGLPTIYDYFSDTGQWYLVMDFIEGKTLEELLAGTTEGWLPIKQALDIGIQLCTVLDYLHGRRPPIIFRDLKPANVMYTDKKQVFLIDFGIARHFKPGQLKDTVSFGSAGYAAPEQYGKTQTTPRSDIYSLGVILHQCLTGNDPANNTPTPFDFPPLNLHGQNAPADLAPLISLMLTMNPDKRPSSIYVIRSFLMRFKSEIIVQEKIQDSTLTKSATPPASSLNQTDKVTSKLTAATPAPVQAVAPSTPKPARVPQTPAPQVVTPRVYSAPPKPVIQPKTTTYTIHHHQAGCIQALAWSPNGARIVLGDSMGKVQIWDATAMHPIYTYRSNASAIYTLAWSPDGTSLVLGDRNGLLEVWYASSGERIYTYRGYSVEMKSVAWSPDSKRIASGNSQGRVLVQDAHNGEHAQIYQGPSSKVEAVAWSPDGKYLAAGDNTGCIRIWESATQKLVFTYTKHTAKIHVLAYDFEGKRIASADNDGRVHVWEAAEKGFSYIYKGHFGEVTVLAWSPTSQRIASGGADATVQLWDAATGAHVFTYREHSARITALAWSPNKQHILSASTDKTLHLWQAK